MQPKNHIKKQDPRSVQIRYIDLLSIGFLHRWLHPDSAIDNGERIVKKNHGAPPIILEVDPDLKQQSYSMLETRGQTLKDWFIGAAHTHLLEASQRTLSLEPRATSPLNALNSGDRMTDKRIRAC